MTATSLETIVHNGPLGARSDAPLTPKQHATFQRLEGFQAPYLQERLANSGVITDPSDYAKAFGEFKKYAALTTIADKQLGMASEQVDAVWHQLILFTREYAGFCRDVLDGSFLHHAPDTSYTPTQKGSVAHFKTLYDQFFGPIPEDVWGTDLECGDSSCAGDGADCGDGGSSCDN